MRGWRKRQGLFGGIVVAALIGCLAAAGTPASAAVQTRTAGGIKYVTKTVSVNPQSLLVDSAKCPDGTSVLGGGETSDGAYGDITLGESHPLDDNDANGEPGDGWRLALVNNDASEHKVAITAVCAPTQVRYVSKPFTIGQNSQSHGQSKCPKGTHVYSGGWFVGYVLATSSSFPIDAQDSDSVRDDGWSVIVDNPFAAQADAKVWAVCGGRFPAYEAQSIGAGPHQDTGLHVDCAANRFAYGGGEANSGALGKVGVSDLGPFGAAAPSDGWHASVDDLSSSALIFEAFAICGKAFG
jgi:hypothetical protein